jgi:(p)ppGpp synthase/HD superfamily hydrolase
MTKIEEAKAFAHEAHNRINHKRKYSGEPYWTHTDAVADIVASIGGTGEMIMAAHLHDILEDVTPKYPAFSEGQIKVLFGEKVLQLVKELTDVYTKVDYPDLNRAQRHAKERERIDKISVEAKTIKLADLINNTASIVEHDKDFAKVYLKEKLELLPYLADGDSSLLQRASIQIMLGCIALGIDIPVVAP